MEDLSGQAAQEEFQTLVESQRDRTLWHLRRDFPVDIRRGSAVNILNSIINHGDRVAWLQAKKLKKWHLQHSR